MKPHWKEGKRGDDYQLSFTKAHWPVCFFSGKICVKPEVKTLALLCVCMISHV